MSRVYIPRAKMLSHLLDVLGHFPEPFDVLLNDGEVFLLHLLFAFANLPKTPYNVETFFMRLYRA